ncbi:energy transducer TonB [Pseudoxanthomonas sp.]|uniref:energy transducer TonB n=1 Tax=Pseudoxanthomonas sp. TaxID=1871049 RepID=UPI003F7F002C
MAHTHPQPEWSPADTADASPPREKNASLLLLWLIALIAVVAAGLAWYKQRQPSPLSLENTAPPVTTPALTAPDERAPAIASRTEKPRADARRSTTASAERAARSQAPRLLAGNPSPQYPASALRAGIGGTVMVRAELDASGQPVDVDVIRRSGNRDLDRAAVQAVRKWRFEPAMRNGKGVASTVQVPVDFKPI